MPLPISQGLPSLLSDTLRSLAPQSSQEPGVLVVRIIRALEVPSQGPGSGPPGALAAPGGLAAAENRFGWLVMPEVLKASALGEAAVECWPCGPEGINSMPLGLSPDCHVTTSHKFPYP